MTNTVTLELTGEESSLERAIESATRQFKTLDDSAATTASSVETSSGKMDRMAERADNLATRTGTLAGGIGALAGGMALLGVESDSVAAKVVGGLSVAIGTLSGIMDIAAIATSSKTVALVASKVAMVATTAATGVATAAQWAWNVAMSANPIGLIIIAVVALVGVIVLIATKTTWFQDIWQQAMKGIKFYIDTFVYVWRDVVWHGVLEPSFKWIGNAISGVIGWFQSIPDKISSAFSGLVNIITWPYKTAFNFISDAWNNTVGKLQWTVPSWVPGIGGNTVGAPRLPRFHEGGMVTGPGPIGAEVLAVLQVGERVLTREQQTQLGGPTHVTNYVTVNGLVELQEFLDWQEGLRNDGRGGEDVSE